MNITKKKEIEEIIGKKCDVCGKIINPITHFNNMTTIYWYEPADQGFSDSHGETDVCCFKCLIKEIQNMKGHWQYIRKIECSNDFLFDKDIDKVKI